jgi:saccharopine dehydrogenase-like NADP-dependent oxidoreductase
LENLIRAGAAVADVSFTPDPPVSLNDSAVKSGSCCVVDCGVAPGLSHILVASAHAELGGLDFARIWVGGMPQSPPPVFHHAVNFNPHDLLAEYVRPARARKSGKDIAPHPLDVPIERYHDQELGQLEAFLSDGLRSLLPSFPDVPDMAELTLRLPGHLDTMAHLREIGLLDDLDARHAIGNVIGERYPAHKYPDVLLMFVEAKHGNQSRAWRLIDRHTNNESAMSRTTGYTTAAIAMLLARKQFTTPGVHPPEHLGKHANLVETVIADLNSHGVKLSTMVPA